MMSIAAGVLFSMSVSAQDLPLLPQDPAVKCSVMPNGLSCYAASNASSASMADFALLRRDYDGKETELLMEDVVVSSEAALDSTLLTLMRRVELNGVPADQAVIVCGDIDVPSVIMKLRYMSLMLDSSSPSPLPEYMWDGDGTVRMSCQTDTLKGLATVSCEWEAPRTPAESMNTIQSAVYEKATWEMGDVACRWIRRNLRRLDIPAASVTFRHSGSTNGISDERFVITATVDAGDAERTEREVKAVLASLGAGKVGTDDFMLAESGYLLGLERASARPVVDNGEYLRMCADAFLYNRPLAGAGERLSFFRSKDVSDGMRAGMFTSMTSALVDMGDCCDTLAEPAADIMRSDTLALPGPGIKQKVRSSRKDAFSGGTVWTFENGFKVIYRKMPTARTLYYSLSINGGFASIEDLLRGESAYMSDYLDCCWICGMKGSEFKKLLNLCGMTMNMRVNLYNTAISGQVSDRNASLLMKGLLAVTGNCRRDTSEVGYYCRSQVLRQRMDEGRDVRAVLDSLMCPGYRYTSVKTGAGVNEYTFLKAEKLYTSITSRMNDGVLVIVGDIHEADLKKLLQLYVGEFKVRPAASRRPSVQYHPVSGWSTYEVEGGRNAAVVAVSCTLPMTASNYFASEIAAMILERRIKEEFKDCGLSVRLSFARSIYPDERFSVFVTLDGDCAAEAVQKVKEVLHDCSGNVDSATVAACKDYVKNAYALRMQTPGYWLQVISLRHMEGKDYTSGNAAKIDAVSAQQLMKIFGTLENGAGAEYIIRKK